MSWSILGIAALSVLNVVTRTFFGFSVAAAEELSQFLILVVTFVGLSYAASLGRHIRMTALYDLLPEGPRKILRLFIVGSTAGLLVALIAWSLAYVGTVRTLGTRSPALQVPLWIVYLSAPLGFSLAAIQYLLAAVKNLSAEGVWLSYEREDGYEDAVQPGV